MTDIKIFTDGSFNPTYKVGAWASIILIQDEKFILKGIEKNYSQHGMELLAIIKSLTFIKDNYNNDYNHLLISTDSQYVIGITEKYNKIMEQNFLTKRGEEIRNAELVKIFINEIANKKIEFTKVRAHEPQSSSPLNKEADKLSRKLVREFIKANFQTT